jgi:4a-hydroxytetrahydrobiopterin dehydratase
MNYADRKCVPCEGGTPPLGPPAVDEALVSLDGWEAREGKTRIHKRYRFRDFVEAMRFVNALAQVAEAEGHHPDFTVHWNLVDVELWTHVIGGLSENDLIVAAKLDRLPEASAARGEPRH